MENKRKRRRSAAPAEKHRDPSAKSRSGHQEPETNTAPDVVYMAPKPFSRSRFLLRLATVAAVVIALVLGVSVFFKVENITVSGAVQYTPWDICAASGIETGENLLTVNRAKASGKIISALPYVHSVRIGIRLPGTVMIDVVETEVTYAALATDETWWLLSAEGKVVEQATEEPSGTKILGVVLENPAVGEMAAAAEQPHQTEPDGASVPVTVTEAQRLQTALEIAQYLERNGIIGDAASIDVTQIGALEIWYGDRYQIKLGDRTQLSYKISCMKNVIDNMQSYAGGIVDLTDPDSIQYKTF